MDDIVGHQYCVISSWVAGREAVLKMSKIVAWTIAWAVAGWTIAAGRVERYKLLGVEGCQSAYIASMNVRQEDMRCTYHPRAETGVALRKCVCKHGWLIRFLYASVGVLMTAAIRASRGCNRVYSVEPAERCPGGQ